MAEAEDEHIVKSMRVQKPCVTALAKLPMMII